MEYSISWVTVGKYLELTGDTRQAVHARRGEGWWIEGNQFKELDGNLWINLTAVECWVAASAWASPPVPQSAPVDAQANAAALPSMGDSDLIKQIADALTALAQPPLPIQYDAWDVDHIARYMKRTPDTVRREIVTDPTFPKPMRPPSVGRAHGLWPARKVVAWLEART